MGNLVPTLIAFILSSSGVYIFHEEGKAGCEPLVSSLFFLFGIFLLLWDLRLFPPSLRSPVRAASIMLHFLLSSFLMEHIMNDFWFPLEASIFLVLPKIAEYEECVLRQVGWKAPGVLSFLKTNIALVLASYATSFFFLVTMLHLTRIIDLRLLRCGTQVFFADIAYRARKTWRKMYKKYLQKRVQEFDDCECEMMNKCRQKRRSRRG